MIRCVQYFKLYYCLSHGNKWFWRVYTGGSSVLESVSPDRKIDVTLMLES